MTPLPLHICNTEDWSCGSFDTLGQSSMRKVLQSQDVFTQVGTWVRVSSLPVSLYPNVSVSLLECSAKHNRGVNEVFYEAARVSIGASAKGAGGYGSSEKGGCIVM
jgi:hypothetical protein